MPEVFKGVRLSLISQLIPREGIVSRYNHFAKSEYNQINFNELKIGQKFREHFFRNGRRANVICNKISEFEYQEDRTKKIHKLNTGNYLVYELKKCGGGC